MTATLSCPSSCLVFSANRGQLEAGSTTTGSSFLPSTPPLALISSMAISTVSFNTVSEMAMVPERLCRMPTLMVSAAYDGSVDRVVRATAAVSALRVKRREFRCCMCASPVVISFHLAARWPVFETAFAWRWGDFREARGLWEYAVWRMPGAVGVLGLSGLTFIAGTSPDWRANSTRIWHRIGPVCLQ